MGGVCGARSIPKKILLIGPKGAGKTTLLYGWCLHTDIETSPTENFNVETIHGVKGGQLFLVWDVADPARRRQFFHGTEGLVYMIDHSQLDDPSSVRSDLTTVLMDRDLINIPLLLVCSKMDLSGCSLSEIEDCLQIKDIMGRRLYGSVAVTREDISTFNDALEKLCDIMFL